jgi:cytochrome c-type biogenesis protein CcmH/NrfF
MDPEQPVAQEGEISPAPSPEEAPAGPSPRSRRVVLGIVIALAVAAAALLLLRRGTPAPTHVPTANSTAGPAGAPAGLNVITAPVKLTPEALMVADRFKCLCGECQDTLGRCTCTRDKGSNDMKEALNRIVSEKKSLAEIEAAMVEKYGRSVLAAPASAGK